MKRVNELLHILLVLIVLAFSVSLINLTLENFLIKLLFFAVIFLVYIGAKKLAAYYLQTDVETRVWQFQRYWFKEKQQLNTPVPIGIILPFLLSVLSLGNVYWLASTQSEITARKSRVLKKHDFYSYSELTEWHVGMIPAAGIFACLILAFIAYFLNLGELGRLAIFFACFNMIPLGNLDGTKIFFGSLIMWFVLAALSLVALGYAILLI
jgi:hypothetical protein